MIRGLALLITLASATAAAAAEPQPEDRIALLQLAERMDRAWTEADADANASLFAENATARFDADPLGEGREAIRAQFRAFFKDRPTGLRHVTSIERIDQLGPDLAFWDAEVRVERKQAAGDWAVATRIRNVTLAIRHRKEWRIHTVRAFPVR